MQNSRPKMNDMVIFYSKAWAASARTDAQSPRRALDHDGEHKRCPDRRFEALKGTRGWGAPATAQGPEAFNRSQHRYTESFPRQLMLGGL